jgi:inositol-phosphate transport system substrate-binding protein
LLLADLGWSAEEIDALAGNIASGDFTFADMADVAQQAVEEGVVEPGNGFWHRPVDGPDFLYYYYGMGGEILGDDGNLIFDTDAALAVYELFADLRAREIMLDNHLGIDWNTEWHPSVSPATDVLFWAGGSWNWADWAANYVADRGGNDYLAENIGFAPIPALATGEPITLTHPLVYMISSQAERPDVAMALIAAITTPELNNRHAIGSGHLGILTTQLESEEYLSAEFLAAVQPMLDFTTFIPNHPNTGDWQSAYFLGINAVESGSLSPEDALAAVLSELENSLGDAVAIR